MYRLGVAEMSGSFVVWTVEQLSACVVMGQSRVHAGALQERAGSYGSGLVTWQGLYMLCCHSEAPLPLLP
jgi:hypothetical protein